MQAVETMVTESSPDGSGMQQSDILPGSLEDRAVGCLAGLAIGDALGAPVEFKVRGTFPLVHGMQDGGPFNLKAGEWTDDTSMALALSDALIQDVELADPAVVMNRWANWFLHGAYSHNGRCFDIGNQTSAALTAWLDQQCLPTTDTEQAGNGSIMRLAPVVIARLRHPEDVLSLAERQSDFTHRNLNCRQSSRQLAAILHDAILHGHEAQMLFKSAEGLKEDDIRPTGFVLDTIKAAVWAAAPRDGFRNSLLRAVNLGGDADTVGAVTGQIAGALYGLSGIPSEWLDVLAWRSSIVEAGRALYAKSSS